MCLLSQGYSAEDCIFALAGGLKTIYLANVSDVVSILDTDTDNIYDEITMNGLGVFYKFDLQPEGNSFGQEGEFANATRLKTSLTFTVPNYDSSLAIQLEELAFADVIAIVETRQKKRFVLGLGRNNSLIGLECEVLTMSSGATKSDIPGTTYTLSANVDIAIKEMLITTTIPV